jgi:hypothetical protein
VWELNGAAKAERLIRDLAKRMQREAPGGSDSRSRRDPHRHPSPPPAGAAALDGLHQRIENMQGTIRCVTRNVKRWRDASMALRRAAAGMMDAQAVASSPTDNCRLSDGLLPSTSPDVPRARGLRGCSRPLAPANVSRSPRTWRTEASCFGPVADVPC